jgi:predicted ATPase
MIFEDAHWVDPTSVEALSRIVDRIRTLGVLLIVTYRPEFEPPWVGRHYVTALSLNRLGERETVALIDRVTANKALPPNIRRDIAERTDGIPLFVEEMTRAVLEAESEGEARKTAAAVPSSALAVPATLHASLMARLDRLGPAKEVAQIGAAMGREFSHSVLAAVVGKTEAQLLSALNRLMTAGLLFQQGVPPHAHYLFKHALVQDAAYGTLLRDARRALHTRIVETLAGQFRDLAERQPELLAHHCTEAGLIEKAALLWGQAGRRSLERSALVEAVAQLTRALNQIATLPSTPSLLREQIKLQVVLITPLMHLKGLAARESREAVERARLLIEQAEARGEPPEDPLLLFSVLYGFFVANLMGFNGDLLRDLAGQFLSLAEKQRTTVPMMIGHRIMGLQLGYTGNLTEARTHYDKSLAAYNAVEHRPLATRFGHDTRVAVLVYRSLTLWCLGYPDAAVADAEHALHDARDIGLAHTLLFAGFQASLTYIQCGNNEVAGALANQVAALADEKDTVFFQAGAMCLRGVLAVADEAPDAVKMINSGIVGWCATGGRLFVPLFLSILARAYAFLNQFEEAQRCISEAIAASENTKERWNAAELQRVRGELALKSPERDAPRAEEHFEHALEIARQQHAKSWELRASMSLARLWRDQGKVRQARELLAPVYGWFTEGFDTRDLKEAKALLEELAA